MEQGFLIDSNAVIDYIGNRLPEAGSLFIDKLPALISIITRIEIMGWYNATSEQILKLQPFIQSAFIFPLTEPVVKQTILLRQAYKIKIPDAIIASTALTENLILITHNTNDFKNIPELKLLDPWSV